MNAPSRVSRTILVVEDEAFVREVTCEILRLAGYQILDAMNATDAQNIFLTSGIEIALLLTDIVLPGSNGRTLAAKLKQVFPALKVLFATGYPEHMTSDYQWRVDCLAKPFSAETLLEKIEGLLGRAASAPFSEFQTRRAYGSALPGECVSEFQTEVLGV
jgi:two-component system, cell cycle sensor histidine kinase and response regulator CckA